MSRSTSVFYDTLSADTAAGTAVVDTVTLSFKGIKVMANFSLSPMASLGAGGFFSAEDFKIYGEVAIIGLGNERYLSGSNHTSSNEPRPLPKGSRTDNITDDDWKWSLHGSRILMNHLRLSAQVASDHFRPGVFTGYRDNNPPTSRASFQSPSDWYWMAKLPCRPCHGM